MEYKSENRICQNCKNDFIIEPEDFNFYEKIKVPPPTFCVECRRQRKAVWRNERSLYKRNCDLCNKNIFSVYPEKSIFPVYCYDCWVSDKWDVGKYSEDLDFSKPFFEQFKNLSNKVPHYALYNINAKRSDYCNISADLKDCYLIFGSWYSENCSYGDSVLESKDSFDNLWITKCDNCFYLVDCENCYKTLFSQECDSCIDSWFLFNCRNCSNCLFCSNLQNKQCCVFNKQLTKEEFDNFKKSFLENLSIDELKKAKGKFEEFKIKTIRRFMIGKNYVNSTGNFIRNSKNIKKSFFIHDDENIKYGFRSVLSQKDSFDIWGCSGGEMAYESLNVDYSSRVFFTLHSWHLLDSVYSIDIKQSSFLFGCYGLKNKNYCILNKQYSKEQYEELLPKIIQHMNDMPYIDSKGIIYKYGEFFPPGLSPFSYNETVAQDYFLLTKDEAQKQGYKWKDLEIKNYKITKQTKDLPSKIEDVDDSILEDIIECQHDQKCNEGCTQAFRIIKPELQFYKNMGLPLPILCPNCRYHEYFKLRNPIKLWHRKCMKTDCTNEFETSYSPDRPEIVYCERCYQQTVY
ncbi:MAG: hypothetical protein NDI62_02115 [Burkholderiales bacterium]|nr:hypothetical protein [Burkholderiales bacterium]